MLGIGFVSVAVGVLFLAGLAGAMPVAGLNPLGPSYCQATNLDGAELLFAQLSGAVCGSPNYIAAYGADVNAVNVPAACQPPL